LLRLQAHSLPVPLPVQLPVPLLAVHLLEMLGDQEVHRLGNLRVVPLP
jgi:hypothetical protein